MLTPLSLWLIFWLAPSAPAAIAAPVASLEIAGLEQALGFLGFDADERARLLDGEIVSHGIEKISETELAVTVAVITPHPMAEVIDLAQEHDPLRLDDDMLAFGKLEDRDPDDETFAGVRFEGDEASELRLLLEAKAGPKLNLSTKEIARFERLHGRFLGRKCERDPACVEAVTAEYQKVLRDRMLAYRKGGLAATAPYARKGGGETRPGDEILRSLSSADLLALALPEVHDLYRRYPEGDSEEFEHEFHWIKQRIQGRPTYILAHRIYFLRPEFALISERHFYVGHSYNSMQIFLGLLPAGDRTIVFYLNHTSTDQVSGFLGGTKRRVARKLMKDEILEMFEAFRRYVDETEGPDAHE